MPPCSDLPEVALFVGPGERGEPPHHWDFVRGIPKRASREPANGVDQATAHPRQTAEERRQRHGARASHGPGVEAIHLPHVVVEADPVAAAPRDQLETTHTLLFPGGDVSQNVFDRPLPLSPGTHDLLLRQP